MKAKLKLYMYTEALCMQIKLENEKFYGYERNIISRWNKSEDMFYDEVLNFISDKNNIIKVGEDKVKGILEEKIKNAEFKNKEKEVRKLLKQLNENPIEVEVEK
jgi:hypothetical protein